MPSLAAAIAASLAGWILDGLFEQYLGMGATLPDPLPLDPFPLLWAWHAEAAQDKRIADANVMVLATATADGFP